MDKFTIHLKKIIIFFSPVITFIRRFLNNKIFIALRYSLQLFGSLTQLTQNRISLISRPKLSDQVNRSPSFNYSKFSICLQGPFYDPYTLETIKIYRKMFGNILITLATWKNGLNKKNILELKKLDVKLLDLDIPDIPYSLQKGFNATTLQIFSTLKSLKLAKDYGVEFSTKHRTDQRALEPDWLQKLYLLQKTFNYSGDILKNRILVLSSSTLKNRVYCIGDQFHFGYIDDLLKFWDSPYYLDGIEELVYNKQQSSPYVINESAVYSESYLVAKFLQRTGYNLKWTLKDHWSVMKNYFLIFDDSFIDFCWDKNDSKISIHPAMYKEKLDHEVDYKKNFSDGMNFSDWLFLLNLDSDDLPWKNVEQEKWVNNNPEGLPPFFKIKKNS